METNDELMTFQQAADLMGVSKCYVYKMVRAGRIPVDFVTGAVKRIHKADVMRFIREEGERQAAGRRSGGKHVKVERVAYNAARKRLDVESAKEDADLRAWIKDIVREVIEERGVGDEYHG